MKNTNSKNSKNSKTGATNKTQTSKAPARPAYRSLSDSGYKTVSGVYASASTWFRDGDSASSTFEEGERSHPFLIVGAEEGSYKGDATVVLHLTDQIRNPDDEQIYKCSLGWNDTRAQFIEIFAENDTPIAAQFVAKWGKNSSPFMAIEDYVADTDETETDDDYIF